MTDKRQGIVLIEDSLEQEEKRALRESLTMIQDPQLSAILAAITDGQKESTRRFDSIDNRFGKLTQRQEEQRKDLEFLKKEVATIKAYDVGLEGRRSRGNDGFAGVSGSRANPYEVSSLESQYELPVTKRRVIAVGVFHEEMAPEQLKEIMERTFSQW